MNYITHELYIFESLDYIQLNHISGSIK